MYEELHEIASNYDGWVLDLIFSCTEDEIIEIIEELDFEDAQQVIELCMELDEWTSYEWDMEE